MNINRFIIVLVCLLLSCILLVVVATACNKNNEDIPPEPTVATNRATPSVSAPSTTATPDVDLTTLSSTMVYAEVANMMVNPEQYVGKTIKVRGEFNTIDNPDTGDTHYMIVIRDALACCAQGLEFFPTSGQQFPGDFPSYSTEIELTGIYTSYLEGDTTFYQIVCRDFTILE